MADYPRLVAVADSALLIEFENRIDVDINIQVLRLKNRLDFLSIEGILETVASYRSVLVHYNCLAISLAELKGYIQPLFAEETSQSSIEKHWRIPVFYGGDGAVDLEEVARLHDLSTEDVIRLHKESDFRVYMVGFAPGWCYLGGLDPILRTPRLNSPRLQVPAGCISIGGQQGMIGALPMPSGWRLLGQTPVRSYAPEREPPFIISAGDRIEFYDISLSEYELMQRCSEKGELVAEEVSVNG
ncbi:MAG: KipI family sensor histidine kinase inhibitor [Porticoccaceae bacterium]|jgi:KipI family sensor histidine kinase inhibitor